MTNEEIILVESQKLAETGAIGYTGNEIKVKTSDGGEIVLRETEPIHTYQGWRNIGYQVQKGEKAIAKFSVWKCVSKKDDKTGEETSTMFLKNAAFFKHSQVRPVEA